MSSVSRGVSASSAAKLAKRPAEQSPTKPSKPIKRPADDSPTNHDRQSQVASARSVTEATHSSPVKRKKLDTLSTAPVTGPKPVQTISSSGSRWGETSAKSAHLASTSSRQPLDHDRGNHPSESSGRERAPRSDQRSATKSADAHRENTAPFRPASTMTSVANTSVLSREREREPPFVRVEGRAKIIGPTASHGAYRVGSGSNVTNPTARYGQSSPPVHQPPFPATSNPGMPHASVVRLCQLVSLLVLVCCLAHSIFHCQQQFMTIL